MSLLHEFQRQQHTPKLFRIHDEHILAGAQLIQLARMALPLTTRRSKSEIMPVARLEGQLPDRHELQFRYWIAVSFDEVAAACRIMPPERTARFRAFMAF